MKKQFLEVGEIVAPHALAGELKVYPWCDTPAFLTSFKRLYLKEGQEQIEIEWCKVHKSMVLLKIKGVDSIEEARLLRGKVLFINREDAVLEEGAFFVQDLMGLAVLDVDTGQGYGVLSQVSKTGANDVYHIARDGKEALIPAIPQVIIDIDIEGGRMLIRPINGLFEVENGGGEGDDYAV